MTGGFIKLLGPISGRGCATGSYASRREGLGTVPASLSDDDAVRHAAGTSPRSDANSLGGITKRACLTRCSFDEPTGFERQNHLMHETERVEKYFCRGLGRHAPVDFTVVDQSQVLALFSRYRLSSLLDFEPALPLARCDSRGRMSFSTSLLSTSKGHHRDNRSRPRTHSERTLR